MKEKILALLMAAFAGVRKDGLNQLARTIALQATTEDEAKALVDKLTKTQVDEFVKEFRADVDKEVSDSNKTFESNLKKKFDLVEKGNSDPNVGSNESLGGRDDIAAMVKNAVADAVKPLQTELEKYKAGDIAKTRLQNLTDKLNECKDETFKAKALKDFARMRFDSEEEFNEYLTDTEMDISSTNQNVANSSLSNHNKPWMSSAKTDGKEATKEELDAVMEKLPV